MELIDTKEYEKEVTCAYRNETYSVRDNGAVLRHRRIASRLRPRDEKWTFGKPNSKTGYMEIASVRIHRIVATAFHGEPPTKEHVVDHIDTNKRNNQSENLRWVTRLENVLLNPITVKRIELVCGVSIDEFLTDPSKFRNKFQEPNYQWMCTVSKEEAHMSKEKLLAWAANNKRPSGESLDGWIFDSLTLQNRQVESTPAFTDIVMAKTLNAAQRNWRMPSEFPCCPQEYTGDPIAAYAEKLKIGSVFCRNDVYTSLVLKSAISDDRQLLYVLSESTEGKNAVKPWALAKISYENGLFVHMSLQSFFSLEGAEKQYCLKQGLEWTGGDSIDDYC